MGVQETSDGALREGLLQPASDRDSGVGGSAVLHEVPVVGDASLLAVEGLQVRKEPVLQHVEIASTGDGAVVPVGVLDEVGANDPVGGDRAPDGDLLGVERSLDCVVRFNPSY